jgi:hypothetical protein
LPFSTFRVAIPSLPGGSHSRTVSPPGFDYPPDDVSLASPSPVCFTRTALVGFSPSEVFPPADPMCLSTHGCPLNIPRRGLHARSTAVRDNAVFQAFIPAGVRSIGGTQLSVARARSSLGVSPSRGHLLSVTLTPSRSLPSQASSLLRPRTIQRSLPRVLTTGQFAFPSRDRYPPQGSCTLLRSTRASEKALLWKHVGTRPKQAFRPPR